MQRAGAGQDSDRAGKTGQRAAVAVKHGGADAEPFERGQPERCKAGLDPCPVWQQTMDQPGKLMLSFFRVLHELHLKSACHHRLEYSSSQGDSLQLERGSRRLMGTYDFNFSDYYGIIKGNALS